MAAVLTYIASHWVDWLFAVLAAVLGIGYRSVSAKLKKEQARSAAIADGVQALLRESIVSNYNKYSEKGFCPIYAKESIKRVYAAYHALGGNDVAQKLYEKILVMDEEPKEE